MCELAPGVRESGLFDDYRRVVETGEPLARESFVYRDVEVGGTVEGVFDIRAAKVGDGMVVLFRDITDRNKKDIALAESEARALVLAELSHALAAADPDPDIVCDRAASLLVREIGDICVIMLRSPGTPQLRLIAVRSRDPRAARWYRAVFEQRPRRSDDSGPLGQVFATGEAVLLPAVDPSDFATIVPAEFGEYMRHYGGGSLVYVPLKIGPSVTGVIAFTRFPTRPDPFTDSDLTLLRDLADRVATSVERARVTAALRDSEEQFRTSFENSPVGILVTRLESGDEGRIVKANPAVCEMLGYTEDELRMRTAIELVHPEDRAASAATMVALLADGHVHDAERRCIRADGETRWIRASSSVVTRMGARYIFAYLEDVTARRQAEAELAFRALHDPLTGLPNRHLFLDHLRLALDQLRRQPGAIAVCYLDLDRFKEVNDGFGHEAGDRVLTEVGRRLARTVRTVDTVSRLAGDEFAVVCPSVDSEDDAAVIAERILAALDEPVAVGEARLHVGASIGITFTRSPASAPEQLLSHADTAMYQAKRRGRHRWEAYTDAVQHCTLQHLAVQRDLRAALDQHRFRLHYQPIVDLRGDRIVGVEALLRLDHPDRGLLPPSAFIDVAEDSDLIVPIGDWVLHEACRQAADWNDRFGPLDVSVNVSGRQATHLAVTEQVVAATADTGLDPARLCLEMTEHVLIGAGESIAADLNRLTDVGVRLALDDFGTGYSSLTYLRRFPVHTVKIDRSFVAGLGENARDTAIVQSITALARSLDLDLVAEGVETPTQRDLLWTLGCRRAQGFHFARPQAAHDITGFLQRKARTAPPPPAPQR
jgi:diguanylate cyclase (GGDEF)-like protein/PAS domain S-box-containing protein